MPGKADVLKSKGNVLLRDGRYPEAEKCYMDAMQEALEGEDHSVLHAIYGNLSNVNHKMENYKDSEKFARLAIQVKPDWPKGYYWAARAAHKMGRLQDAMTLANKGVDNCISNGDLISLLESLRAEKKNKTAKAKQRPPPPPPLPPLIRADGPTTEQKGATADRAPDTATPPGIWSTILAEAPVGEISEQTAAAARAGDPDALYQEVSAMVRRGSIALRRGGGACEAMAEYKRALQVVAKHPQLSLSSAELGSLRYCYAMACHEVATIDALLSAEDELLTLIDSARPMPAAFYQLGKVYLRLNRFDQAHGVLSKCSSILAQGVRGEMCVFPGTEATIPDMERAWKGTLRGEVDVLLGQCQPAPRPDALCRYENCLCHISVPDITKPGERRQQTRHGIYYSDVDFAGFMKVQCLAKCHLEFHMTCWRQLKEQFGSETQRTTDKDILNTPCFTPDCGANICHIVTISSNGLEKHDISSDELKRQQQKQPQKQLSKQQKKLAAQAQRKYNVGKWRKQDDGRRDSVTGPADAEAQRSEREPTVEPEVTPPTARDQAAPPPTADVAPDLREMTVLRRDVDEVPAAKKTKKKKKGSSQRRRQADLQLWEQPDETVYTGPPVNVIYATDEVDLAGRLQTLDELRMLEFSTRALIPDTSVRPATVPRVESASEEEHAMTESAYQFLYDYLKGCGPTASTDSGLLTMTSQLSGHCQQLIAEHGGLEGFLLRVPRFYQLDGRLCCELDVSLAEAMVGSAVAELLPAVTEPAELAGPAARPEQAQAEAGGESDSEPMEATDTTTSGSSTAGSSESVEQFQFDSNTGELIEDEVGCGADPDPNNGELTGGEVGPSADPDPDPNNGELTGGEVGPSADPDPDPDPNTGELTGGEVGPSADPDPDPNTGELTGGEVGPSADPDPNTGKLTGSEVGPSADPDPDPNTGELTGDEVGPSAARLCSGDADPPASEDSDGFASCSELDVRAGDGGCGDGAWAADPDLGDKETEVPQNSSSVTYPSSGFLPDERAAYLKKLQLQVHQLSTEKMTLIKDLSLSRISKLRLERTVRQLMRACGGTAPTGEADSGTTDGQQKVSALPETQRELAETREQLTELQKNAAEAEQGLTEAQKQLTESREQLSEARRALAESQQQATSARQRLTEGQEQLSAAHKQHDEDKNGWVAARQELQASLKLRMQQNVEHEEQLEVMMHDLAESEQRVAFHAGQLATLQRQLDDAAQRASLQEQQMKHVLEQACSSGQSALQAELAEAQQQAEQQAELAEAQQQAEQQRLERLQAQTALEESRHSERTTRARYVSLLSSAGEARLDAAARRCSDGVSAALRLAETRNDTLLAQTTVRRLADAVTAIEQERATFKETIKAACKAIRAKKSIDLESLKLPDIPDIDSILASSQDDSVQSSSAAAAKDAASASADVGQAPISVPDRAPHTASAAVGQAPTSVPGRAPRTASAAVGQAPTSVPGRAPHKASVARTSANPTWSGAVLAAQAVRSRTSSPCPVPTPAAMQLSAAATAQPAATPFSSLVEEIQLRCGEPADVVRKQLAVYRSQRGGTLRGVGQPQIVSDVVARMAAKRTANGSAERAVVPPTQHLHKEPSKEDCVICWEPCSATSSRELRCGHRFHDLCIGRWQQEGVLLSTCPVCRQPFTSYSEFPTL